MPKGPVYLSPGVLRRAFGLVGFLIILAGSADAQRGGRGRGFGDGGGGGGGTPLPGSTPLGLRATAQLPADNPITPEKIALGRQLFFDPALSRDRTVACASCHQPAAAFADNNRVAKGILGRTGARNSPTLFNRVYGRSFFWDGRAATLEQAVMMPVQDTLEMAMSLPEVIARIQTDAGYRTLFQEAFPEAEISQLTVAQALATYVRSLRAGNSAVDRYEAGDLSALSESAARGRVLFFGRADCDDCHRGSNFTDEGFEDLGLPSTDAGRFNVTGNEGDRGEFKVPTLRDVALTAPYMHDGSLATLEDVVEFYDRGGGQAFGGGGGRGRRGIRPLGLSATEKADVVAFLRALTSETTTR